ncbi:MAG TPA: hypothetical protein PLM85_08985 [Nitrosomonas sp.]|nr:hypothetical protein [Nitrosomonas sp.]HNG37194.1 hypothetical protein [Nitrosomonas sp.]
MNDDSNIKNESEEEQDRRLNQQATMEKLKTPIKEVKSLKTLDELLKEKR